MIVRSLVSEDWQYAGRDEYWKIYSNGSLTIRQIKQSLNERGRYVPTSLKKAALVKALDRSDRGVLRYEQYSVHELKLFCTQRRIQASGFEIKKARRDQLIAVLEEADEGATFKRLYDLPAELRVQIYLHYFKSLPKLDEPVQPPILRSSSLIRQEALPLFYSTCTFKLSVLWQSYTGSTHPSVQTRTHLFDAISEDRLRSIWKFAFEYYDWSEAKARTTLWREGEATFKRNPKLVLENHGPLDPGRNVLLFLEAVRTRSAGDGLLKSDIPVLLEISKGNVQYQSDTEEAVGR